MSVLLIGTTLLFVVILVSYGFLGVHTLLRTHAVLGPVSIDIREAVRRLLEVLREGRNWTLIRIVLLYVGLGGLLVALLAREWLGAVVATTTFTLIWWLRVRTVTPPVVLLLGTSTVTAIKRQRDIKRYVSPLRVVSLLDIDVPWDPSLTHEMSLDCFRTTNEDDWWSVIAHLMEISPVIAIDAAAETEGVMREGMHILSTDLVRKCLFLTPPDGFAPILDHLLPTSGIERRDLWIAAYEDAPRAIAEMVAELV